MVEAGKHRLTFYGAAAMIPMPRVPRHPRLPPAATAPAAAAEGSTAAAAEDSMAAAAAAGSMPAEAAGLTEAADLMAALQEARPAGLHDLAVAAPGGTVQAALLLQTAPAPS